MNKGWIKLHRKIQDCCIWQKNEPFDSRSAWIDLLLLASHKEKKIVIDNKTMIIERGSYMTSFVILSERWKWSRAKTMRFFKLLESEHMVNTKRTSKGTLVTIENYGVFQGSDTTVDTTVDTQNNNVKNIKNGKKEKNGKNIKEKDSTNVEPKKKRYIIPPPVEDVAAYCAERNNGIDAQTFLDYYQSRGWMTGNTKIKDWQAAVRTWERKDREGNYGRTRRNEKPPETDEYATEFYKQLGIEQ